jgi:transposase
VFGILERGGKVSVNIVKDVSAETLVHETVTKVIRESIVYADKWKGYDSLMFCGFRHLNVDHGCKFKQGKVCINGEEGFWSFARGDDFTMYAGQLMHLWESLTKKGTG